MSMGPNKPRPRTAPANSSSARKYDYLKINKAAVKAGLVSVREVEVRIDGDGDGGGGGDGEM